MRRIQIDALYSKEVKAFCSNLFSSRTSKFILPTVQLQTLHDKLRPLKDKQFREYIKLVIKDYDQILVATPAEMNTYITKFDTILPRTLLHQKIPFKKIKFYEAVVSAMRYEDLRAKEFLIFLGKKQFNTCIYCNAQLAIVVTQKIKEKGKIKTVRRANLELDHFHPKSKHPFLSTTFYNLFPVCGNCNRHKSSLPALFNLYTENDSEVDAFTFSLDNKSVTKYWRTKNHRDLKVIFDTTNGDVNLLENHNSLFAIQGIYDTQTDLAEEIIHKATAYSEAYKKHLTSTFKKIFPDEALVKRLVLGNYINEEDIHKRPMSKFTQDIARQMKLL